MATVEEPRTRREEVAERREAAAKLRKRFDVWVAKLGGWDRPGLKADLGAMAAYLTKDDPEPLTASSLGAWVTNWLKDNNLGIQGLAAFERLNNTFQASSDVQATYIDLVRRANGAIELPEGVDWPFTIELVELSSLFADDAYQRPIDDQWVRTMLLKFDERLVGTLDVSERRKGKRAIMDGRQRFETMLQLGKTTCWVTIYHGMTVAQEADFFYRKNRARKQMHYFYAFRARAVSGDVTANLIEEIVSAAGFRLGAKTVDPTVITAVRAIEDIYDFPTENAWGNALAPALETARVCWSGRTSGLDGTLLRGLGRFYSLYGPEEIQRDHFHEALTSLGPVLVLGRSRDSKDNPQKNLGSRIDVAVATTLAEIHNAGLARPDRVSLDHIPRPQRQRAFSTRRAPRT